MEVTGETAIRLAEKYGIPIHKRPDEREGYRADIPLEDAQWILQNGDPASIYADADPALIADVLRDSTT